MKKLLTQLTLFVIALFITGSCSVSKVNYSSDDVFIHGTYTVADRMMGRESVFPDNYQEFQFTYIFASPAWEVSDFDLPQNQINKKYVDDLEYKDMPGHDYVETLIKSIHRNNNKILCSFNGHIFIEIATVPERRLKFAKMMAQLVKKHGYDGIEIDWEHTITIPEHLLFMKDIRQELTALKLKRQLYLTTALHSTHKYTKVQADELSSYVDWVNIMTYDMGGGDWGRVATHNTPLDMMKEHLAYWNVFSPKKICIGLANYGFYYNGISPGENLPESEKLNKYGRYCNYLELPKLIQNGWTEEWDDVAECSYYFSPDRKEFITMDSKRSLEAKVKWIKESGYKGLFWWEFHLDWLAPKKRSDRGEHLLIDDVTKLL